MPNDITLYEKILDLSYRNNMTREQIAARLNLELEHINRALCYDHMHRNDKPTEADLKQIFTT